MIRIANPKDFWAGALFIVIGGVALAYALGYPPGSAGRMGPGYFPRILGVLLLALGIAILVRGVSTSGPALGGWPWRAMIMILGSVVLFALALPRLGLVPTGFLLVLTSGFAATDIKVRRHLVFAVALSAAAACLFVYALQLEIPLWPWSP